MSRRLFTGIIVIIAAVLAATALIGFYMWNRSWQGRIYPGVRITGVELGGMTEREAEQKLEPVRNEFLASGVTLVLGGHSWHVSRRDLGFQFDAAENTHLAMMIGRSGPAGERARELWQAYRHGVDIPCKTALDDSKARSMLQKYAKDLYTPPQNARLTVSSDYAVKVVEGKPGKVLDLDGSIRSLQENAYPFTGVLELQLTDQQPQVTTQDIMAMKITGLLSAYTTYYDTTNVNRTYNINVAADALDNNLIKPGEVFSFNRIVGPRSEEAGYKEALVIERNKFTPGLGGGVCQVSSTLYNTALLSGLEITERYNHSLPVAYVPLGRDATVAYGSYDLRFRNNTGGCLYIKTRAGGGALAIAILGDTSGKKKVGLETVVDKVLDFKVVNQDDPTLYQGKALVENEGVKGYQVRAFRVIDGGRKLLSNDLYAPVDKIVHIGTMPVPENPLPPGQIQQPAAASNLIPAQQPAIQPFLPGAAPAPAPATQ